jgi:hypothetical protein
LPSGTGQSFTFCTRGPAAVGDRQAVQRTLVPPDALNWCEVENEVVSGIPDDAILKTARARNADLVVIGLPRRLIRELTRRIQAEYAEMSGLSVTLVQAQQLWAIDEPTCAVAFKALIKRGYSGRRQKDDTSDRERMRRGVERQYIIKNLLLISAGIDVGAMVRGNDRSGTSRRLS